MYSTKDYHFDLPEDRIAKHPVSPRDHSKLLVLDRSKKTISHHHFYELPKFLEPGDLVVGNNSKVMKARLHGKKYPSGGQIEVFLLRELSELVFECLMKSSAPQKVGFEFFVEKEDKKIFGKIISDERKKELGVVKVEFERSPIKENFGELPLPPYMNRKATLDDEKSYQTTYSKNLGSVAAPTAGLHFTKDTFLELEKRGVFWSEVTLHVGLGTFRPVKADRPEEHEMHEEWYQVADETTEKLIQTKKNQKKVIAVGTTVARTLESHMKKTPDSNLKSTKVFFYPGSNEKMEFVDALLTNFHLPESTLLMLVCSFAGYEFVMRAYEEALKTGYRFYSYGDAMLVL